MLVGETDMEAAKARGLIHNNDNPDKTKKHKVVRGKVCMEGVLLSRSEADRSQEGMGLLRGLQT